MVLGWQTVRHDSGRKSKRDGIAELPFSAEFKCQMCCFVSTCVDVEDFKLDAAAAQPPKLVRPNVLPKLLIE